MAGPIQFKRKRGRYWDPKKDAFKDRLRWRMDCFPRKDPSMNRVGESIEFIRVGPGHYAAVSYTP